MLEGGLSVILKVMHDYASDAEIQKRGCQALHVLALYYVNKETVAQEGGVAAILNAMKSHTNEGLLNVYGCRAFLILAQCFNNRPSMVHGGVIGVV